MTSSRSLRWAVPAVACALVAGAVVLPAVAADRPTDLSPRTAAQLLVDLSAQRQDALSGTVVATSRLGLPELPGSHHETGPASLASGSNTLRIWSDGPERQRVALLGTLAQYDVVRDGRDLWTYSSQQDEAVHRVLPVHAEHAAAPLGTQVPTTPAAAADAALAALDPTTEVTVEQAVSVAGRDARQLVLTPEDPDTLVGSVRIAVDAATSAPLRVQVFAARAELPALEVGFTDVEFATPDREVFTFSPPAGADVVEKGELVLPEHGGSRAQSPARTGARPTVVGEGWSSVLVLPGVEVPAAQQAQLGQLTTRVPEGRLLSTALVSALLTDDGRLLVGAVTPAALRDAA